MNKELKECQYRGCDIEIMPHENFCSDTCLYRDEILQQNKEIKKLKKEKESLKKTGEELFDRVEMVYNLLMNIQPKLSNLQESLRGKSASFNTIDFQIGLVMDELKGEDE